MALKNLREATCGVCVFNCCGGGSGNEGERPRIIFCQFPYGLFSFKAAKADTIHRNFLITVFLRSDFIKGLHDHRVKLTVGQKVNSIRLQTQSQQ